MSSNAELSEKATPAWIEAEGWKKRCLKAEAKLAALVTACDKYFFDRAESGRCFCELLTGDVIKICTACNLKAALKAAKED